MDQNGTTSSSHRMYHNRSASGRDPGSSELVERRQETQVQIGQMMAGPPPLVLTCLGLGSCVGVLLYDRVNRVGGMAHPMLPSIDQGQSPDRPGRFVDAATAMLVEQIGQNGGRPRFLEATLVGGASLFDFSNPALEVGRRNIDAAREILAEMGIRIRAEDLGGRKGRTVHFEVATGHIMVRITGQEWQDL